MSTSTSTSSRLPSSATGAGSTSGQSAGAGKYVPPGRRSQQSTPALSSASGSTSGSSSRSPMSYSSGSQRSLPPSRQGDWASTSTSSSREPWKRPSTSDWSYSQPGPSQGQSQTYSAPPHVRQNQFGRGDPLSVIPPHNRQSQFGRGDPSSVIQRSTPPAYRSYKPESAHLFLAGDSFVGALNPAKGPPPEEDVPETEGETEEERVDYGRIKRLWAEYDAIPKMIKIKKEKGAAAKGLNNPNSRKAISSSVLHHGLSTYSDRYHDYNKTPKFFMMMFGNVDLNINYLWQLVNRDITIDSFTPSELASSHTTSFTPVRSKHTVVGATTKSADHTDNDHTTLALGPSLFVTKVVREYTSFIEREIVNGPIGAKLRNLEDAANDIHARGIGPSKNRVLVGGALPPMVKDRVLYRILGKYVDQHVEARAAEMEAKGRQGRRSVSVSPVRAKHEVLEHADDSGSRTPSPVAPSEAELEGGPDPSSSQRSTEVNAGSDTNPNNLLAESVATRLTVNDDADDEPGREAMSDSERKAELESKSTFQHLLTLQPPVCSLTIRTRMIREFNSQLRQFCEKYPTILSYVGINEAMESAHPDPSSSEEGEGEGSEVLRYYCSQVEGDGANVHPTWERTYPLWLEVLRGHGVDVDSFPDVDLEGTEAAWTAEKGARLEKSRFKT